MNIDWENIIDDYLLDKLSNLEVQIIENQLDANADLKEQVKDQQLLIQALEVAGRNEFKDRLQLIHNQNFGSGEVSLTRSPSRKNFIIGLAVITLLTTFLALQWQKYNQTNESLYLASFEPYSYQSANRAVGGITLFEVAELYKNKNYDKFLTASDKLVNSENTFRSEFILAVGIANLEVGNYDKALGYFNSIDASGDFNFEDEVQWYSALTYLRSNNISKAKIHLQILIDDSTSDHHEQAKDLIQKINLLKN